MLSRPSSQLQPNASPHFAGLDPHRGCLHGPVWAPRQASCAPAPRTSRSLQRHPDAFPAGTSALRSAGGVLVILRLKRAHERPADLPRRCLKDQSLPFGLTQRIKGTCAPPISFLNAGSVLAQLGLTTDFPGLARKH